MDFHYVGLKTQRDIVEREMTAWKNMSIEKKKNEGSIYPLQEAVYNYFVSTEHALTHKEDLQTVINISKEIFHMLGTECEKYDNLVHDNRDLLRDVITELKKTPGWLEKVINDERIDETCSAIIMCGDYDTGRYSWEKFNQHVVGLDYEGLIDVIHEVAPYIPRQHSLEHLRILVSLGTEVLEGLENVASSGSKKRKREEGDDGSRSGREEGDDGSRSGSSMRTLPHDFII